MGLLIRLASMFVVLLCWGFSLNAQAFTSTSVNEVEARTGSSVSTSNSEKWSRTFTPHSGMSARTTQRGKMSFQQSPGSNINTSMYLGAVTVAATNNLEVGTVPLFWLVPEHRTNALAKWNFYRTDSLDIAWGASLSSFELNAYDDWGPYQFSDTKVNTLTNQILINYKPKYSRIWWGLLGGWTVSKAITDVTITDYDLIEKKVMGNSKHTFEYGLDASYGFGKMDLTLGLSRLRELGVAAGEITYFGYGGTVAFYRPGKFFSKPALGLQYVPAARKASVLFTTSFN